MINKEVLLPEVFCTFIISIGFFSSMNFLIKSKGCWLVKSGYFFILDYHLTQMSIGISLVPVRMTSAFPVILESWALKTVAGKAFHYLPRGWLYFKTLPLWRENTLVLYLDFSTEKRTKQAVCVFSFHRKRNFYSKNMKVETKIISVRFLNVIKKLENGQIEQRKRKYHKSRWMR